HRGDHDRQRLPGQKCPRQPAPAAQKTAAVTRCAGPQPVKKVPSSRHVRMDGTHTGKLSVESVRAALRRVRGSALNFVEKGDTRGEGFLSCAAGRNGSPLERVAFAAR